MNIQVVVFCVVCVMWNDTIILEVYPTSIFFISPWRWKQHGPPKR